MPYVEVSLDDFDKDDIITYLEDEGYTVTDDTDIEQDAELERIWAAMRLGRNEQALELMRTYVCDKLGKVL